MEDLFSCSGWCNTSPVYSFTDVNDGIPGSKACYVEFKDYFSSKGELYGIVGLVIASFLLLLLILGCCLCCHPKTKEHKGNYYQRMQYYDN